MGVIEEKGLKMATVGLSSYECQSIEIKINSLIDRQQLVITMEVRDRRGDE